MTARPNALASIIGIATLVVFGVGVAAAATTSATKVYRSTAVLDVSIPRYSPPDPNWGNTRSPIQRHLVLALFAFEVSGPKAVKELAAEEPNAPGVATLRTHRFTVSVTAHDAGIAIAATGRSANAAAESARAVTNALIELVSYSSEGPDFVTTEAAHLVRDVSVPNAPYGTLRLRNLTAGAMAGLLLGLGLALVRKRRVQETDPNLVSH